MSGLTFRIPVRVAEIAVELSEQRRARGRKVAVAAGRELSEGAKALAARHAERRDRLIQDGATFSLGVAGGIAAVTTAAKFFGG